MAVSQNKRIEWLDIAKGITILLMIVGHTSIPNGLSRFIWAFHMPLFFIASGWVSRWEKYSVMVFILHKLRTLMLPFLVYSIIVLALKCNDVEECIDWLQKGWGGYALWFIPVLMLASVVARLVYCLPGEKSRWGVMIGLWGIAAALSYARISLPWTLTSVPFATFLLLLGTEGSKRFWSLTKWTSRSILSIIVLVGITGSISRYWHLDMAWNNIVPILPLTIGAIAGTLMIFILSVWIEKHLPFCSRILRGIGKETYIVVAFSQIIIILLNAHFALGFILKYVFLVLLLVALKYLKDGVNKLFGTRIL